jgi:hypothetical protein
VDLSDEGVGEVYVEMGERVDIVCTIQGTNNISWSRLQGPISRNAERKAVSSDLEKYTYNIMCTLTF